MLIRWVTLYSGSEIQSHQPKVQETEYPSPPCLIRHIFETDIYWGNIHCKHYHDNRPKISGIPVPWRALPFSSPGNTHSTVRSTQNNLPILDEPQSSKLTHCLVQFGHILYRNVCLICLRYREKDFFSLLSWIEKFILLVQLCSSATSWWSTLIGGVNGNRWIKASKLQ